MQVCFGSAICNACSDRRERWPGPACVRVNQVFATRRHVASLCRGRCNLGVAMDPQRIPSAFPADSHGFQKDSVWIPYGFLRDSLWLSFVFPMNSVWIPDGFPRDCQRVPFGFLKDSLCVPFGSLMDSGDPRDSLRILDGFLMD